MKSGALWFLIAFACAVSLLFHRPTTPLILADTDTAVLLQAIEERDDPWSWFAGDWPLENHFYRPVSTLVFEMDHRLHGDNPVGFGWTQAIIAALCALALFWLFSELTGRLALGAAACLVFTIWHFPPMWLSWVSTLVVGVGIATLLIALFRRTGRLLVAVVAFFACLLLAHELHPMIEFGYRIVQWLPGRTASTATLFALLSLASYARFERSYSARPRPATSVSLPANRTENQFDQARPVKRPIWLLVSLFSLMLALGAYEQAVMVPSLILGTAIWFSFNYRKPHWLVPAASWVLLVGYLALRAGLVPTEASGYQLQQFRTGAGLMIDLSEFLAPAMHRLTQFWLAMDTSPYLLMNPEVLGRLLYGLAFPFTVVGAIQCARGKWCAQPWMGWKLLVYGYLASALAFLPMAWLKIFEHYYHLPLALRAGFLIALAMLAMKLVLEAVSPPPVRLNDEPDVEDAVSDATGSSVEI